MSHLMHFRFDIDAFARAERAKEQAEKAARCKALHAELAAHGGQTPSKPKGKSKKDEQGSEPPRKRLRRGP